MVDIITDVRLHNNFLFCSGDPAAIDEVPNDMPDLGHMRVGWDVVAVGQNKSRQHVWMLFKEAL
jgi:hypothetical protein